MDPKIKDMARAKIKKLVGWFIAIFFGMAIMGFFIGFAEGKYESDKLSTLAICFGFVALGAYLIFRAKKRITLIEESKEYSNFISAGQHTFSDIARSVGKSEDEVAKKIVVMIKRGYIKEVYLDSTKRTVINKNEPQKAYVSVRCEGCNAVAKLQEGTVTKCEFCGAYLSAK